MSAIIEHLPRLVRPAAVIRIPEGPDPAAVGAALAARLDDAAAFLMCGELLPGEGKPIADALRSGRSVVLVWVGPSELPAEVADAWTEACEGAYVHPLRHLAFTPADRVERPGKLLVVHLAAGASPRPHRVPLWHLDPSEIAEAIQAGISGHLLPVLGVPPAPVPSMPDLCFLEGRDPEGTSRRLVPAMLEDEGHITWTDLAELLHYGNETIVDRLLQLGKMDAEKYAFYHGARRMLVTEGGRGPRGFEVASFPSIHHVIWLFERSFESRGDVFRGQRDARWRLESSLLRPPADVGNLTDRACTTETFLRLLRRRKSEVFGHEPSDEELLAVAQHFGFPTPLLDFTWSLRIAAFFATLGANTPGVGVIYSLPSPGRWRLERDPGEPLGLALLPALGLRVGALQVVEPNLRDDDNRIARQRGLFVAGFSARDLQQVAIDRIYFEQQPGYVFEDPRRRITRDHLLPEGTLLSKLAEEARTRRASRPALRLSASLATVPLPPETVVGSQGSLLWSQLHRAHEYFEELRRTIETLGDGEAARVRAGVQAVLRDYLAWIGAERDVGNVADGRDPLRLPLSRACDRLATLGGLGAKALFDEAEAATRSSLEELCGPRDKPAGALAAIARSVALYLAAWERLRHVDGTGAKDVTNLSMFLLSGG